MRSRTIRAVAVVKDLFFVARIRETARLAGAGLVLARTPEEIGAAVAAGPVDLAIVDLTAEGWDHEALFAALGGAAAPVPILGFTTHVLAARTRPWHARCTRVMTKETLTRELGRVLTDGLAA